jgi:uncharacterized protein YjbI with pentapeptide repeats
LTGARLTHATFDTASLGGADLSGAVLTHADFSECYLGGAKFKKADLTNANFSMANVEEADFTEAILTDARLSEAQARGAKLSRASLVKVDFTKANLTNADLSGADARRAVFAGAKLDGAKFTGAKLGGLVGTGSAVEGATAEWVDASAEGDGSKRLPQDLLAGLLSGLWPSDAGQRQAKRYFGPGDVLRNATLEFGEGASIEIESLFEQCSIALGRGTELVVGAGGVLQGCQIKGSGNVTINGKFIENESPGIVGVSQLIVTSGGSLIGAVKQPSEPTRFGFEPGCKLRMKISKHGS